MWQLHSRVAVRDRHVVARRDFLRRLALGGAVAGLGGWTDWLGLRADELRRRGKACILLWMEGGPSQFETFSPKPGHANGGETSAIATNVSGIEIADNFPRLAQRMDQLALVRSVTSKEGNHQRATFLMHTGYLPLGSVKHPALGSLAAQQLGDASAELPTFVQIGGKQTYGAGMLGVEYDPLRVTNPQEPPQNTELSTAPDRLERRLALMHELEAGYARRGAEREVAQHRKLYEKSTRMVLSPEMSAFDLSLESSDVHAAYGQHPFGSGCLLARRLVEAGVSFVEVDLGGWDTHFDNFARVKNLAGQVDQSMSQLIDDLRQRGLWENTLVIWMGEFGRTPKINPRGGRDHYPRASNVLLGGAGVAGGRLVGATDAGGNEVTDRPVSVTDLFQTFCQCLDMDPALENMSSIGRPIKVVDGGTPIREILV